MYVCVDTCVDTAAMQFGAQCTDERTNEQLTGAGGAPGSQDVNFSLYVETCLKIM